MIFSGLHKTSVIDYPGKVSCVLFLSGCNFDCPYCHNPELVKGHLSRLPVLDERAFFGFLEERIGFLDGVVISGGEPTLHKGLISVCERIKRMGYPVKLDTNGSRPKVIKQLILEGLVDYIAMDIKTDPFLYSLHIVKDHLPDDILSSIWTIVESGLAYEFRTTCAKPIIDPQIIAEIAKTIKGAMLYVLQRFHNSKFLHREFFQETELLYNDAELLHLKSIGRTWVKKCILL